MPQAVAASMKRCLPLCVMLLSCTPEKEATTTASSPVVSDAIQEAVVRIDRALMHDYRLIAEKRREYHHTPPLPALPPMADDTIFLRRACIDFAGRLPRPDEVRAFIADPSPD